MRKKGRKRRTRKRGKEKKLLSITFKNEMTRSNKVAENTGVMKLNYKILEHA